MQKQITIKKKITIDFNRNSCGNCKQKIQKNITKREYVGVWYDDVEHTVPFCNAFEQILDYNKNTKTKKLQRCSDCLKFGNGTNN